ncbi:hypothetical protein PT974_11008 [Cladobotryum mycophilum]|uniref:Uncharacterized protein n=1 Tax=Cladobotryum mycophilum TaxID=491253 RepID=A0ABR0SBD5_9HYPO
MRQAQEDIKDIKQLQKHYAEDILTAQLLKPAVSADLLNAPMASIVGRAYQESKEWQDITLKAYPPPPEKKVKKAKDKGSRHPRVVVPVPEEQKSMEQV